MDKIDLIPACLQSFQNDPQFRASLKAAMPVETHPTFEAVECDGMFLSNGMLAPAAHAFIKRLNAALPIVETTLAMLGDPAIKARALEYRNRVETRRSVYAASRQSPPPGLLNRAGSLAKAIGSETKAMVRRQATLTAAQVAARLAACASCGQLRSNRTCAKCGCFVDAKARFRSQTCPLGKWPAK
jgi:ribosomal protein L32